MNELKMKKLNQVILGTIVGVVSMNSSFAQTGAVAKDSVLVTTGTSSSVKSEPMDKIATPGVVTQVGTVSNHPSNKRELKGFAKDLPLITVMKQITPNGWVVKKSDSDDSKVDIQKPISWQGGRTWIETLGTITQVYQLNALVNWDDKVITLSNSVKSVPKAKKSVFELATTEQAPAPTKVVDIAVGSSEQPPVEVTPVATAPVKAPIAPVAVVVAPAPVVVAPVAVAPAPVKPVIAQQTWEITSSKSLKDNVAVWAEKAGYRLVWTADDYGVVDSKIIAGEFDSENGPIKQLSEDYGPESRAENPLSFQFYQNKTLVVENMTFEQSGFSQYSKKN